MLVAARVVVDLGDYEELKLVVAGRKGHIWQLHRCGGLPTGDNGYLVETDFELIKPATRTHADISRLQLMFFVCNPQ